MALSYINPLVVGRTPPSHPNPPWDMEHLYDFIYTRAMLPQYNGALIHMPQGWVHTMASAPWLGMAADVQEVWTRVLGRVIAERPGYKWTLYSGWQMSSAYSIYGRPRPDDGRGFIAEPDWADADNVQHVRMLRDLNIQEWADRGVTGFVFDSGSKDPCEIVRWKNKLQRVVDRVGLEAIPWDVDEQQIKWWAAGRGVEYHGNQRYRNGLPFLEPVPAPASAHVWLVHVMDGLTAQDVVDMITRGWTPVVNHSYDALYTEAMQIIDGTPDDRPRPGGEVTGG